MKVHKNMATFATPTPFVNLELRGKLYKTLMMIAYSTTTITQSHHRARGMIALMNRHHNIPQDEMVFLANRQQFAIWQ